MRVEKLDSGRLRDWTERTTMGGLCLATVAFPFSKALIEIGTTTALLAWAVNRFARFRHGETLWPRWQGLKAVERAAAVFVVANLLSLAVSSDPQQSLRGLLAKTLEQLWLLVVAADTLRTPGAFRAWCIALGIGLIIAAVDGFVQALTGHDLLFHRQSYIWYRLSASFDNPNSLSGYAVTIGPIWCGQLLNAASSWRRRVWAGLCLSLSIALLLGSFAVAGFLATLGAFVVMGMVIAKRRVWLVLGGLALLIGVSALVREYPREKLSRLVTGQDLSLRDRIYMWRAGWGMVRDRPWLGHGPNTFMGRYLEYWVGGEHQPRYAHNCYLQVLAELGLVGWSTFMVLLGMILRVVWIGTKRSRSGTFSPVVIGGLLAGLVGFLIQAGLDTIFYELRLSLLFFMVAGAAIAAAGQAATPQPIRPHHEPQWQPSSLTVTA